MTNTARLADLHKVLSDDELAALLKVCAGKDFRDRRDEAMIRLLLDCGMRVSELCDLTVDGVDLDQGMAIVTGKGDKVRPVYFSARTTRAVDRYLRTRSGHRWAHLAAVGRTLRDHADRGRHRIFYVVRRRCGGGGSRRCVRRCGEGETAKAGGDGGGAGAGPGCRVR